MRQTCALIFGISVAVAIMPLLERSGLAQAPRTDPSLRVAVVNGEAVTLGEVDAALGQRPAPLTAPTARQIRQMRSEMLTPLIDDLLMRQFMRQNGPKINPIEIDKHIATLQSSLRAQNKSMVEYLRDINQTEQQVRASIQILLQLDRYVKDHTNETTLKNYYETNKDFFDKSTVRTSHIVFRVKSDAPAGEREKAKQKLQAIRAEILAGRMDFAKAAAQYSQSPSAAEGGDIGLIRRKFENVDEGYAKAAFAMKVGELSDVVETEFGMHLIKVTERNEGKPSKYEVVADDVRDCYAEDLRISLLNQLRKSAKVTVALP